MGKTFDDLFNEFFNNKKPSQQGQENLGLNKIIEALQNFRHMGIEENLGNSIEKELGPPDRIEESTEEGYVYKKSVWNTPQGQFVKIATELAETPSETTLDEQLKDALEIEDFETAIILRDKINKLNTPKDENNPKG